MVLPYCSQGELLIKVVVFVFLAMFNLVLFDMLEDEQMYDLSDMII